MAVKKRIIVVDFAFIGKLIPYFAREIMVFPKGLEPSTFGLTVLFPPSFFEKYRILAKKCR